MSENTIESVMLNIYDHGQESPKILDVVWDTQGNDLDPAVVEFRTDGDEFEFSLSDVRKGFFDVLFDSKKSVIGDMETCEEQGYGLGLIEKDGDRVLLSIGSLIEDDVYVRDLELSTEDASMLLGKL